MIRLATSTVYSSSTFIACVVVALMVTPISCSIMREALGQAPPVEREGAYALGRPGGACMIRTVVLPFDKGAGGPRSAKRAGRRRDLVRRGRRRAYDSARVDVKWS
jgi:hypothetical protein